MFEVRREPGAIQAHTDTRLARPMQLLLLALLISELGAAAWYFTPAVSRGEASTMHLLLAFLVAPAVTYSLAAGLNRLSLTFAPDRFDIARHPLPNLSHFACPLDEVLCFSADYHIAKRPDGQQNGVSFPGMRRPQTLGELSRVGLLQRGLWNVHWTVYVELAGGFRHRVASAPSEETARETCDLLGSLLLEARARSAG